MKMMGLLGGTFNPIHFGHLRLAQEVANALSLDEVRFIPSAHPPHRPDPGISRVHRTAMVNLAIHDNPLFMLDDRELKREGYSYTIDTLVSLRQGMCSEVALCLLLGKDAFLGLAGWHRWQELLDYCHIVVANRPTTKPQDTPEAINALLANHQVEYASALHQASHGHILMQPITALDISATYIRTAIEQGANPRYLLPDAVLDYIRKHGLYLPGEEQDPPPGNPQQE